MGLLIFAVDFISAFIQVTQLLRHRRSRVIPAAPATLWKLLVFDLRTKVENVTASTSASAASTKMRQGG
jgi:hypothetical protein